MGQQSIGKASLVLSATHGRLKSGLDNAYAKVQGFKNRVSGVFAGGFAGALGGKLFAEALSTTKDLTDIGKRAKGIGAGTAEFMALGQAAQKAGVDAEQFGGLLGKMQAKLGGAALGGEAAKALGQLGIEIDSLKGKRPDEQFLLVADAIAKVPDASQQAFFATKLFEEQGVKLLPMLTQGSGKLQEFVDKQKKLGMALSETDMAKLMKVREAMPKVQAIFEGAWNKMVVALSPILAGVATRLTRLAERAQPFIDAVVRGFELFWEIADAALTEVGSAFDDIWDTVSGWLGDSLNGASAWQTVETIVVEVLKAISKGVAYVYQFGASVAAVGAVIVGAWLEAFDQVKHTIADIIRLTQKFTLAGQLLPELYEDAAKTVEKTDWAKMGREMTDWAGRQWAGWDEMPNRLARIDGWFDRVLHKKKEFERKPKLADPRSGTAVKESFSAALEKGSKAEYSIKARFEMGAQASIAKQQLDAQKAANGLLGGIAAGVKALADKPAALGTI